MVAVVLNPFPTVFLLFSLAVVCRHCEAGNIGMYALNASPSHTHIFYVMGESLIAKGHNVTFYTIFKPKVQVDGLNVVYFKEIGDYYDLIFPNLFNKDGPISDGEFFGALGPLFNNICRMVLQTKEFKELMAKKEKTFDVSITDGFVHDCTLPLIGMASNSIIYAMPSAIQPVLAWKFNVPVPLAYVSNTFQSRMNFLERVQNVLLNVFGVAVAHPSTMKLFEQVCSELMPPGSPTVQEVLDKVSLFFSNTHPATDYVTPNLPFLKFVGGLTINEPKPLPKDLEDFMNGSGEHGVILVSFGSIVPEDVMPENAKRALVEAFSRIPQRVIWKYRGELPGLSPNVKLVGWMPQQAILAHPKTKAFITHGGHMSLQESAYYGVPLIGMPVFLDQGFNMIKASDMGFAVKLEWKGITTDIVMEALNSVIKDKSYKTSVMERKAIFRDNLVNPRDEVVYWVEYLIRHPGTTHLRPKLDHLNTAQYLLLDVIGLVLLIVFVILFVSYKVLKLVVRCLMGNRTNKQKTGGEKKKN